MKDAIRLCLVDTTPRGRIWSVRNACVCLGYPRLCGLPLEKVFLRFVCGACEEEAPQILTSVVRLLPGIVYCAIIIIVILGHRPERY